MGTNTIFEVKRAIFFKISIPPHKIEANESLIILWLDFFHQVTILKPTHDKMDKPHK